jgi:hypothetical protein
LTESTEQSVRAESRLFNIVQVDVESFTVPSSQHLQVFGFPFLMKLRPLKELKNRCIKQDGRSASPSLIA